MAKKYVPDGACLVCNKGLGFGKLKVTNHKNVSIYGDKSATEGDKVPNENIPSLGICSITRSACKPVPTKWSGAQQGVTIGPYRKLLDDSKLGCSIGGQISIYFSVPMALLAIRHNVSEEAGNKAKRLGAKIDDWFKHQFDEQEKFNNLMPDATYRNFKLGVVEGVYGGVKGIGEGLLFLKKMRDKAVDAGIHAITHPVETAGKVKDVAVVTKNATLKTVDWVSNTDNLKIAAASVGEAQAKAYNWVTTSGNVEKATSSALNNTVEKLSKAKDWASQQSARDWGNYTGRGAFEAGLMATGVGEAKAVVSGAEAANVAAKVGEGANVAAKVGEGANVAAKTAEAANTTEKLAKGANVADKAAETRTLGEVVSETEKVRTPKPIVNPKFIVGEEIAGKKIVAVREGTNGKVAVIGRRMPDHVNVVGEELKLKGNNVELFNEESQKLKTFKIDGKNYDWNDISRDFADNKSYIRTGTWIDESDLPNTLMYKANKIWADKLATQGYTVLDMGYPLGTNTQSVFYNMELETLFP